MDQFNFINRNDVPLLKSEPLHVVFRATAEVGDFDATYYDWTVASSTVYGSPRVDLDPANLYALEHFTFSADVDEGDFMSAIVDTSASSGGTLGVPRFHLYVDSEKGGPILLQPIPLPQYYQEAAFPKWKQYTKERQDGTDSDSIAYQGIKQTNQFQGAFEARLQQIGPLLGKQKISLVFAFGLIEIRDEAFIKAYRSNLPQRMGAYHG